MNSKVFFICAALAASTPALAASGTLALDTAIHQALSYSPKLKASLAGIGASHGTRQQGALGPNPSFSAEAENILGTSPTKGFDEAELTFGVEQPIELGGKRHARVKAAEAQVTIAELEYRSQALDLIRDTQLAWAEAVAAHEEVKLAKDQQALASDVLQSVSKRVSAAAEPAIQQSKSEVALASSKIAVQKAERRYSAAMQGLAQLWGEEALSHRMETEGFFSIQKPGPSPTSLADNPDLQLLEAGISLAGANLGIEKSHAVPDITVGAGVRDLRGPDSQAFVASLSIPFPVFNRNQGAILKAGHEVTRAEHQKAATLQDIRVALTRTKNTLETAWLEAESLEHDILPAAERAFMQARKGYQAGKFAYIEVLDAQRTLADVRMQRAEAIKGYHIAQAQFDRLTGKNIGLLNATNGVPHDKK